MKQKNEVLQINLPETVNTNGGKSTKAVIHHVFFWLKNPSSKDDLDKLLAGLQTLQNIKAVKGFYIGVPAATEKREVIDNSYHASELLFFNSIEDQKTYQDDPIHKKFVEDCSHLWEKVIVYDMQAVAI